MPRVRAKQVWLSLMVVVMFAPIFLATGSADFRPAWMSDMIAGLPVFPLMVASLVAIFVVLVWVFAGTSFGEADEGSDRS